MPTGWSFFNRQGSNLQIVNNRLEVGQVDTSGGIYKPFNAAGVSKVQIDYHANIANVNSGQSNAAMLFRNAANLEAGYVFAGPAKSGFGLNTMQFNSDLQNPGGPYSRILGVTTPAVFGNYHVSTGARQGSCRVIYTAIGCITSCKWALMTQPRSGLSVTAPVGSQLRVLPDHRAGVDSRACKYRACRAARMA